MYKYIISGLVLIGFGVILGYFYPGQDEGHGGDESMTASITRGRAQVLETNPFSTDTKRGTESVQSMANRLAMLEQRIVALEMIIADATSESIDESDTALNKEDVSPDNTSNSPSQALSMESLINAGLDPQVASDILSRKNQLELHKLELRDRAARAGYLGTARYNRELAALNANDVSLRDEIGDAAYDRYLYVTGQNNRVKVASVMQGSAAEQAGIENGDLILNYNGQTVFKWSELQQATMGGELGEYVSLVILRDGSELNLWLPRGPLGVRLDTTRLNPES